ncbi:methyl-accepting chemotaxis protein [Paraliobacillus salinarum]|uniref:methyl-accepting chemotaxis protein n=1 Tax=Paraliobacillus salinarum TaxID=1158996 RepID=UPI0015F65CD3|nr:HAMP domain-containing methyl-accepting chemotaxis protein [Paraliobacillus salinarum]
MKITGKLIGTTLSIVLIMIVMGLLSVTALSNINQNGKEMYFDKIVPMEDLNQIVRLVENTQVNLLTAALYEDERYATMVEDNTEEITQYIDRLNEAPLTTNEQELFQLFKADWSELVNGVSSNIAHIRSNEYDKALDGISKDSNKFNNISSNLNELLQINQKNIQEFNLRNKGQFEKSRFNVLFLILIATVAAVIIGVVMGRSIGTPLRKVARRMDDVANGVLTNEPLNIKRKDEIGMLVLATNKMQENLQQVLQQIKQATANVTTQSEELTQSANEVQEGSKQIATTMEELSDGAESQANSATMLTESMDQLLNKIDLANKENVTTVKEAKRILTQTKQGSESMDQSVEMIQSIRDTVHQSVDKVKQLNEESQEISKLVQFIQDIAEQTNLLALNAAIEAARAGEHGKGFAVVADEVRKLAEQVTQSVQGITTIVTRIQNHSDEATAVLSNGYTTVEEGSKQIKQTGEVFEKIDESYTTLVSRLQNVASHLENIVQNSSKIDTAIQDVAAVSQESAAGVEETAASSQQSLSAMEEVSYTAEELARLAEQLEKEVARFQI